MGLLDDLLGGAAGPTVDYWSCKVPYFIDDEWPLAGAPKEFAWMDDKLIPVSGTCGLVGWQFRMWGDRPKGEGVVYTGSYFENVNTGKKIWTVHAWPDKQGLLNKAGDNIALTDPPVGAPTSPFLGDPDVPSAGPPPGIELTDPIKDPTVPGGEFQTVAPGGNKLAPEIRKAGIPNWAWILGVVVVGGIIVNRVRKGRKRKRMRKSLVSARSTSIATRRPRRRRPAYERG